MMKHFLNRFLFWGLFALALAGAAFWTAQTWPLAKEGSSVEKKGDLASTIQTLAGEVPAFFPLPSGDLSRREPFEAFLKKKAEVAGVLLEVERFEIVHSHFGLHLPLVNYHFVFNPGAARVFLIGGHYDTYQKFGDMPGAVDFKIQGGNDGGSVVIGILALLDYFAAHRESLGTEGLVLSLFDGEELGTTLSRSTFQEYSSGSKHSLRKGFYKEKDIRCMLCLDMLGFEQPEIEKELGYQVTDNYSCDHKLFLEFMQIGKKYRLILDTSLNNDLRPITLVDDHQPFHDAGIPAFLVLHWNKQYFPYFHTMDDTFSRLNLRKVEAILRTTIDFLGKQTAK